MSKSDFQFVGDSILPALQQRLEETESPIRTLDYLAVRVLNADLEEYAELRGVSPERVRWNARD